jgi:exodeoxyribonuclease VII small subunit
MAKQLTYIEAFEELQQIVNDIEEGETGIDQLSEKVKRAAELIKICKNKLMFGMLSGDPFQAFVRKPTNPFKPPFNKQSCIYSYFQNVLFLQI